MSKHKGNIGINASITKYINANLHVFIRGDMVRDEADSREDSPGSVLLNLTPTAKELFNNLNIRASLFYLLDKDYNNPSPINTIPTDIPRPGRTFYLGLGYTF